MCGRECTQVLYLWVLWLDSVGSERHQRDKRDNPILAEEDTHSPKNDLTCFSFPKKKKKKLGGLFQSLFSFNFPLLFPSAQLFPPYQSLLCHHLPFFATPVMYLAVTQDGFH